MKKSKNNPLKRPIYSTFILGFSKKVDGRKFLLKNTRNFLNTFVKSKEKLLSKGAYNKELFDKLVREAI